MTTGFGIQFPVKLLPSCPVQLPTSPGGIYCKATRSHSTVYSSYIISIHSIIEKNWCAPRLVNPPTLFSRTVALGRHGSGPRRGVTPCLRGTGVGHRSVITTIKPSLSKSWYLLWNFFCFFFVNFSFWDQSDILEIYFFYKQCEFSPNWPEHSQTYTLM